MQKNHPRLVPALVRGVSVLDVIAKSKQGLNVTDISKELGMPKSSIHGICITLSELNMLNKKPDQTYKLGPHIMRWSNRFMQETDVATEFATIWDKSSTLPGATITLSVLENTEVVYIAARNAESSLEFDFRVGMRLPAIYTATGKAFLSYKNDFEVRQMWEEAIPEPLTKHSNQNIDSLLSELALIRLNGYSVDNQQVTDGMICYGAAVVDSLNLPIAGVAVSLPIEAIEEIGKENIIKCVKDISQKISIRLGAEL